MKQRTLFSPKVLKKALAGKALSIPKEHLEIIQDWQKKTEFGGKETNLDGAFISEFIIPLLGYKGVHSSGTWTIGKNIQISSGNVDVALGHFSPKENKIVAPFELKGPKTKDLDAIMPGRHKSPVQQAWEYAMDAKGAQWVLVSNMLEVRLYAVGYGRQAYEAFFLRDLHKPEEYARFCLLLSAKAILEGGTAELLKKSEQADKDITNLLYRDYKKLRSDLIQGLQKHNPKLAAEDAIQFAQTILDRVLFIAFAEDTLLLPERSLAEAYEFHDDYANMTVWGRFVSLFNWVDKGFPKRKIPPYNGGLFRQNKAIDKLVVPDSLCEGFKKLGEYDFASEISVNILGHIFEQSITDLEEIKAQLEDVEYDAKKGKRKKDGVFYTPDYITRYIVEQAVGSWLDERRKELGFYDLPVLEPKDYPKFQTAKPNIKSKKITKTNAKLKINAKGKKHLAFWQAYKDKLANIKIIDPACGSGAFLVQAFDYLLEEGLRVNSEISRLQGGMIDIFERLDTSILKNNLYGVDLNPESVEITKLSLWLKTANNQEKLTYLDDNIKCGNSVVADKAVHANAFNWDDEFKFGRFDVVIGNPPYVRMEVLKPIKPYLEKHFATATDRADLFIYFYEQGINLLKPNGWLGYISNRTFFKTGSGSNLRQLLSTEVTLRRIVDFGDRQIFEGATTYPAILVLTKNKPAKKHVISFTAVTSDHVDFSTLEEPAPTYPQAGLGEGSWQLENSNAAGVRAKLAKYSTLKEVYGSPMYGIKTGLNEAFVIDQDIRNKILAKDPHSDDLIKPFLEGKDLDKWVVYPRRKYLIYTPKGQVDIDKYPAIKEHLLPFKKALEKRATKQEWFELQQAQFAYKPVFEATKIIYSDISNHNPFSLDSKGFFSSNTAYMIGNADWYLLALLNSKIAWYYWCGLSAILRGGFLRMFNQNIEKLPIPKASKEQKSMLGKLAKKCQEAAEARYNAQQKVIKRIPDLSPNPAIKLNGKLLAWWEMDFAAFSKEIEKVFKQPIPLKQRNDWESFLSESRQQVNDLTSHIKQLEQKINEQVYELFKLTPDEIAIVEGN